MLNKGISRNLVTSDACKHIVIRLASLFSLILTAIGLIYYYRQGGIKDIGLLETGLRDVGVYIDGGNRVLGGVNPYLKGLRGGTYGVIPIALLFKLVPLQFATIYFQILSFLGIAVFIKFLGIGWNLNLENYAVMLASIMVFSSTRELLATNQIIALCLGFLGGGLILLQLDSKVARIAGIGLVTVAIDLKPHIFGLFLVMLLINYRKYRELTAIITYLVTCHLIIDLFHRRILEIDWLEMLAGFQNRATESGLGDSVTFWPIISSVFQVQNFSRMLLVTPFLLVALASILCFGKKMTQLSVLLSAFAPSFLFYFHYYDALPILIIAFMASLEARSQVMTILAISFWNLSLLAKEIDSLRNLLFLACFLVLIVVVFNKTGIYKTVLTVSVLSLIIRQLVYGSITSPGTLQSVVSTINISLGIIIILSTKAKFNFSQEPKIQSST